MDIFAINYYIKEDEVATTEQQDAAIFDLYTVGYFLLYLQTARRDETSAILWGVFFYKPITTRGGVNPTLFNAGTQLHPVPSTDRG